MNKFAFAVVGAIAVEAVMHDDIVAARRYLAGGGWRELKELRPSNWRSLFFQLVAGVPLAECGGVPSYGPGDVLLTEREKAAA